ncbi:unnamed protein product [Caenorhabditis angaria]|uniref:Sdz-33 F-box domain-containing protein n=1 Tax=Caenorhabditis angaria TaxID=860376 RepID=A0A9P1ISC3_9PELO|nr:unnamed protein product [Caenorhabditis angaria]
MEEESQQIEDTDPKNPFKTLPIEMNKMVLEYLDPISKINFGRSSKFCDFVSTIYDDQVVEIAWNGSPRDFSFRLRNSPNVMYSVWLVTREEPNRTINVAQISDVFEDFTRIDNQEELWVTKFYANMLDETRNVNSRLWEKEFRGNNFDLSVRYFLELLRRNQNSIRNLSIFCDDRMSQFMSNLSINNYNLFFPRNLETIKVTGNLPNYEKLFMIPDVTIDGTELNLEALKNFKSSFLILSEKTISLEDYKEYLELWSQGELHENLEKIEWNTGNSRMSRPPIEANIFESSFADKIGPRENTREGYVQRFEIITNILETNYRLIGVFVENVILSGLPPLNSKVTVEKKPID